MSVTWKNVLVGAAAIVVGSGGLIALGTALDTSMVAEGVTCADWAAQAEQLRDPSTQKLVLIGLTNDLDPDTIPEAFEHSAKGYRTLGHRAGGALEYDPDSCGRPVRFPFDCVKVGNNRLCRLRAIPRVAGNWKLYASETADVHYFGGCGEALAACLASSISNADCRDLFEPLVGYVLPNGLGDNCCGESCDGCRCERGRVSCEGRPFGGDCYHGGPRPTCPYAQMLPVAETVGCYDIEQQGQDKSATQAQEVFTDGELEIE